MKKKSLFFCLIVFLYYLCKRICTSQQKYIDMAKYINPFTDVGFKIIFGQDINKSLLLDFLNNLLTGEKEIVDITFLDKEQLPDVVEGRSAIYDILCKTSEEEHIIVEMQNREQPFFKKRSIYYASKAIARQGEKGVKWAFNIRSVYFVSFLNFTLDDIGSEFRTDVALMNMKTKKQFSEDLRLIYLQLPYFTKEAEDCENNFDRWIYVLKHMEALNRLPWEAQSPIFKRLGEIAEISQLSTEDRIKYDAAIQWYRDNAFLLEGAEEVGLQKGMKKGLEQGRAEGRTEGLKETARNLKSMGLGVADIQKATGLSEEEIREL